MLKKATNQAVASPVAIVLMIMQQTETTNLKDLDLNLLQIIF